MKDKPKHLTPLKYLNSIPEEIAAITESQKIKLATIKLRHAPRNIGGQYVYNTQHAIHTNCGPLSKPDDNNDVVCTLFYCLSALYTIHAIVDILPELCRSLPSRMSCLHGSRCMTSRQVVTMAAYISLPAGSI